ncbi:MAG TPA: hypothetical protein PK472_11095 [Pseudomonadota bacterium]|nr:hypothetical protein [Pseudomonadota bacterium]
MSDDELEFEEYKQKIDQLTLRSGSTLRDAIGFGLGARATELKSGGKLNLTFVPQLDTHRGLRRVRLRLREVIPATDAPVKLAANQG